MSRLCGIDIGLHTGIRGTIRGTVHLLELLMQHGWQPGFGDQISFLPLGDDEDFDWQFVPRNAWSEVLAVIRQKEDAGEQVGLNMVWKESPVGGNFFFSTDGINARIWTVWNAYRPLLAGCDWLTDHGWYLQRIVPPILNAGIAIELLGSSDSY